MKSASQSSCPSPRSVRRHQERRVKARWRWRIRRFWLVKNPADVERLAVRRAHHNKCDCWDCGIGPMARRPDLPWETEDWDDGDEDRLLDPLLGVLATL